MLQPALIIDTCVNQNPASEDVFLESALLVLDKTGTDDESEFNIRLATLDDTIYFFWIRTIFGAFWLFWNNMA